MQKTTKKLPNIRRRKSLTIEDRVKREAAQRAFDITNMLEKKDMIEVKVMKRPERDPEAIEKADQLQEIHLVMR